MAEAGQELGKMTIAEFDASVANSQEGDTFELIDGVPLLVGDPTETREQIASNIGARLKLGMDKRGCRTYQGGMAVQASASPAYCPCICWSEEGRTLSQDRKGLGKRSAVNI